MIRVVVSCFPADMSAPEEMGVVEITSDEPVGEGSSDKPVGNYSIWAQRNSPRNPRRKRQIRAHLEGFNQHEGDVWTLLREVLAALDKKDFGEEP